MVLFCPFPPQTSVYSQALWREICQQVVQVAYAKEVAVHPWHLFDAGDNAAFIGVPDLMRCRMNILNHPSFRERKLYARAAAQYLMP